MNPVYTAASATTELGWVLGLTTALFFAAFTGWIFYALTPTNAATFRAAARLPLDSSDEGTGP
jgi:cbb3-type cytochrome oxidase subunit 3